MAIKTVQIYNTITPLDTTPGFDRLNHQHLPTRELLTGLVERGEIPRYRGDETTFVVTETEITLTMEWTSLAGAQDYMAACEAYSAAEDPDGTYMRSIEIVQD